MRRMQRLGWAAPALILACLPAQAQPPAAPAAPAGSSGVAARVNGQPILESAVKRALERRPPDRREEDRKEILNHFIDNALIDQYVLQLPQCTVSKEEIDKKMEIVRAELAQPNKDFAKWLEEEHLTEADLRQEIAADIRWNKYCDSQADEAKLKQLFDSDKDVFNGAMVRARHILLTPAMTDAKAVETATGQLRAIKKWIEDQVEAKMKDVGETDPFVRERKRQQILDDAFAEAAGKYSQCPSKAQGGDVDYFQRTGRMVEAFSKAAFALQKYQMSDVVQTQFGVHLILVIDRKPGLDVKYDDVKADVKDEFCDRLRNEIVARVKPQAKIEITPAPK